MIFDRWGELLFVTTNPADSWNGKLNNVGEILQEGVYVWRVMAKDGNTGDLHEYIGNVTMLKKVVNE
jgi:hypothetical protein